MTAEKENTKPTLREAVREALVTLSTDASAADVASLINRQYARFRWEIAQKRKTNAWHTLVSEQRQQLRQVAVLKEVANEAEDALDGTRIDAFEEILAVVKRIGLGRLQAGLDGWQRMLNAANGNKDVAERFLTLMEEQHLTLTS